jgi:hypothetical protein
MIFITPVARLSPANTVGTLVAVILSCWAAFIFLRGSIAGVAPLYSKGLLERILHFTAGVAFSAIALYAAAILLRKSVPLITK